MTYKKFYADKLFTGTQMLTESMLITDDRGIVQEIISASGAGDDIKRLQGILCPGLINCHCHLELSHMRSIIPEKTGLIDFVFSVVTQRHFAEEDILRAIADAENEMMRNGIVGVGDICNNPLTIAQKSKHNIDYYNFIEVSGCLPAIAEIRMKRSLDVYEDFCHPSTTNDQLVTPNSQQCSLVPHAPYSVSQNLWQLLQPYYQHKTVSIHNQETDFEDELFLQGSGDFMRMYKMMNIDCGFFTASGKSSLQSYFDKLKGADNVILVHNTFTKEPDILYAKQTARQNEQNLFFCLCANANLYIENKLPPVDMLDNLDVAMVLGTDSLASNWSLSILDEIKTIQKHFPAIGIKQLLQAATLNGAMALNMSDKLGSFEKGKQPGVLLLSEDMGSVEKLF